MENLISMTDFVLEQERDFNEGITGWKEYTNSTINYAKFLKQPLELWMFMPCVDNEVFNYSKHGNKEQYNEAKERCLFKVSNSDLVIILLKEYKNIEELSNDIVKFKLTETAKKMLF